MAESGLKEAIEGLDKLKFAVALTLVLMVFIVVTFIVAIFVTPLPGPHPPRCGSYSSGVFSLPLWLMEGGLRHVSQGLLLEGFL
jgi:hypothetical protein